MIIEDLYNDEILYFNDVQFKIIYCYSSMNDKIIFFCEAKFVKQRSKSRSDTL